MLSQRLAFLDQLHEPAAPSANGAPHNTAVFRAARQRMRLPAILCGDDRHAQAVPFNRRVFESEAGRVCLAFDRPQGSEALEPGPASLTKTVLLDRLERPERHFLRFVRGHVVADRAGILAGDGEPIGHGRFEIETLHTCLERRRPLFALGHLARPLPVFRLAHQVEHAQCFAEGRVVEIPGGVQPGRQLALVQRRGAQRKFGDETWGWGAGHGLLPVCAQTSVFNRFKRALILPVLSGKGSRPRRANLLSSPCLKVGASRRSW